LDARLILWYRERRTKIDANLIVNPTYVRRQKVSFKQLQRQGFKLSRIFKHSPPSSKWYGRFMKRHGLSLQRPKRRQKLEFNEACKCVTSFFSYIRKASTWAPKRGSMGAFTLRNVSNMDKSPLQLSGDQSKKETSTQLICKIKFIILV